MSTMQTTTTVTSPLPTLVLPALASVRELHAEEAERWMHFVKAQPEANLYHTLLWRDVIQEAFGHSPIYLICEAGNDIRGVLPMFLVRLPFLGSKLISLPYDIGSGGALAIDNTAERAFVSMP